MRSILREAGLGRALYRCLYAPASRVRASIAAGGPLEEWRTARGRAAMEAAAHELPLLSAPAVTTEPLELYVLTGRRFWYQTVFCLWSLARVSGRVLAPVVIDDGSLTPDCYAPIARVFPRARCVDEREVLARLESSLSASRFPSLRERRKTFPLLRKLTDVHAGSSGWKLFIDSDVLFFRRPDLLLGWADHPENPFCATDVEYAYGYPIELLNELAGRPVQERLNTGLLGLRSDDIDWDHMEQWCRTLIDRAGTHYYQEQALVALYLAGRRPVRAPLEDYVTFPRAPEAEACRAVMHHYVATSKRLYFRRNWRRALEVLA